jgi:hypothetical protein
MERDQFAQRFDSAAVRARSFAQTLVVESLPEALRFRVVLNNSYDGNPLHADERVFPEDSAMERGLALLRCSQDEVVELLWRDGLVPEWIDLSVCASVPNATVIETSCCGRYTANAELLYHEPAHAPFHVLGPPLPVGYDWQRSRDAKFSVFDRAECCSLDELAALDAHAHKLWSLTLHGSAFTDQALGSVPHARNLEVVEIVGSPLHGSGLTQLSIHPKLRLLRVRLHGVEHFSLPDLAELPSLRTLELYNLPRGGWAGSGFARTARRLDELHLHSALALTLPSEWPSSLARLRLVADRVEGGVLPARLDRLTLEVPGQDADELERLLASLQAVNHLDLRSTPVSDALLDRALKGVKVGSLHR